MAAYPLTLLSASIKAMQESLERIKMGLPTDDIIATFTETKEQILMMVISTKLFPYDENLF